MVLVGWFLIILGVISVALGEIAAGRKVFGLPPSQLALPPPFGVVAGANSLSLWLALILVGLVLIYYGAQLAGIA
jgi:hypothetical protein